MLIKFDFSSKTGILVVKFAFATANLKIETLRMRRRFARVLQRSIFNEALVSRVWYITWSTRPQKIAWLSVRLQEQIDSRRQNYSRSRAGFPVYCTLSLIKGSRVMWCLLDQSEISFDLVHVTFPRAFHGLLASASWLVHFSNYDVDVGGFLIALGYRCAITIAREISCHGCLFLFPI